MTLHLSFSITETLQTKTEVLLELLNCIRWSQVSEAGFRHLICLFLPQSTLTSQILQGLPFWVCQ